MYERIYNVNLLDDLHNYFPAILYESDRFRTVQDLLFYIKENATQRFNLYEHGRRSYQSRQVPQNTIHTPPLQPQRRDSIVTDLSYLVPLLRSLDRIIPQQSFQDVIIHASEELINTSSTTTCLVSDLENSCPICQDRMIQGETIRRLNACHHEFHSDCVDRWFLRRSVLCPVCRHDIRNPEVRRSPEESFDFLTGRYY
jgi:hypothetical protein